jgi:hypothetical protein
VQATPSSPVAAAIIPLPGKMRRGRRYHPVATRRRRYFRLAASEFGFKFLLLAFLMAGCATDKPSVRLAPAQAPQGKFSQIYGDAHYRFVGANRSLDNAGAEVLVCNLARDQWKRITEVSLANSKLGHQPKLVHAYMDFATIYQNRDYVPLPLHANADGSTGLAVLPDKIEFDAGRAVYLLWFNSGLRDDAATTKLEIWKKDLDKSFKGK